jgi:hypothetical protein
VHQTNRWEHWVAVYDGSQGTHLNRIDLYLNGVVQAEDITSTPIATLTDSSTNVTRIGADSDQAGDFDGIVDEARIYNRALSASEVMDLYGSGAIRLAANSKTLTSGSRLGPGNGLVGHWSFDGGDTSWTSESAGTVTDGSGNGNTGTLTGMTRSIAAQIGKLGQALSFNGTSAYINVGNSSTYNFTSSAFSVAFWVKATASSAYLVARGEILTEGWQITLNTTAVEIDTSQASAAQATRSSTSIVDSQWHHIVVTRSGTTAKIYLDGTEGGYAVTGTHTNPTTSTANLYIGTDVSTAILKTMSMDDVRIYNRELTATEAKQLYNLGKATITP